MRQLLDKLYMATAVAAAIGMVGLFLAVMASIIGRQFNLNVIGMDAYAGYLMAACGFLSMGYTLKTGGHIRVTLILSPLKGRWRKAFELFALMLALLLTGLLCFHSGKLAYDSYIYHDISVNNDATPLWIPQLSMAIGGMVFVIALIDELILELLDRRPREADSEMLRSE